MALTPAVSPNKRQAQWQEKEQGYLWVAFKMPWILQPESGLSSWEGARKEPWNSLLFPKHAGPLTFQAATRAAISLSVANTHLPKLNQDSRAGRSSEVPGLVVLYPVTMKNPFISVLHGPLILQDFCLSNKQHLPSNNGLIDQRLIHCPNWTSSQQIFTLCWSDSSPKQRNLIFSPVWGSLISNNCVTLGGLPGER